MNASLEPMLEMAVKAEEILVRNQGVDAILKLTSQTTKLSQVSQFAVEIKTLPEIRDLQKTVAQLQEVTKKADKLKPMIISKYLSSPAQEWLRQQRVSFADATGNFLILDPEKGRFLQSDAGAKSNPWKGPGRDRSTLKGEAAAKVVRALIEKIPPYSVPQLTKSAKSSTGVTYRVVEYLEKQGNLTREEKVTNNRITSQIAEVDWQKILTAWSKDYSFSENNEVTSYIEPRGIEELLKKLRKIDPNSYAVTSSVAAANFAKYAESKQIRIYTKNAESLAKKLNLTEVDSGTNVQIATTEYGSVFTGTKVIDGINTVALAQIAVDLLSGPGRNPSEGEALMNWMKTNIEKWRTND